MRRPSMTPRKSNRTEVVARALLTWDTCSLREIRYVMGTVATLKVADTARTMMKLT